jgi:hypothetical protein
MLDRIAQQREPRIGVIRTPGGRTRFTRECKAYLEAWFYTHFCHPFPSPDEFEELTRRWRLSDEQVRTFFVNLRGRCPKPPGLDMKGGWSRLGLLWKRRRPKAK